MQKLGAEATRPELSRDLGGETRQSAEAPANNLGSAQLEYALLPISELEPFQIRDLRPQVCERLRERIAAGYNPARPLTVVRDNGRYLVADGNHRLHVLRELGVAAVPCVIRDGDPYSMAVRCNEDEETYAPMDLFDWLDIIGKLRDEGLTQAQIGERIGWSRGAVSNYILLADSIATRVLDLSKAHQEGRVADDATRVTFTFTEGWFRNSGMYRLWPEYQLALMEAFIADRFNWSREKVQREAAKYERWQTFIQIARDELADTADLDEVIRLIEADTFRSEAQLRQKIADLNAEASNRLICGDALQVLADMPDASIDLVITDPPYGIDYRSNRSQYEGHVTKRGIENDGLDEALALFDKACELFQKKTKADAHLYVFVGWQTEPQFRAIIEKHGFAVRNVLIWDKGNHGAGDLEYAWGNRYEMIIYATKGKRKLNKRMGDIISVSRLSADKMIHPTQKPVELIRVLLEASARKADTVCDPFMGSGSTIKAAKQFGGLNYIGVELDREMFERARAFIGGEARG